MSIKATATVLGDKAIITSAGSPAGDIATALLDAADNPTDVRTVTTTSGMGWQVPVAVAKRAGLIQPPATRKTGK